MFLARVCLHVHASARADMCFTSSGQYTDTSLFISACVRARLSMHACVRVCVCANVYLSEYVCVRFLVCAWISTCLRPCFRIRNSTDVGQSDGAYFYSVVEKNTRTKWRPPSNHMAAAMAEFGLQLD